MSEHTTEPQDVQGIPAAQAEAESEGTEGRFPVDLPSGATVYVLPQSEWRRSAQDAVTAGDFDSWAELVLRKQDLDAWDEWMETDPRLGDIQEFFEALGKVTGLVAGGNRASRRASQRTQRR